MPDGVGYEVLRMEYPISEGRVMYLAKKTYEKIMKSKLIDITGIRVDDSKLIIEYEKGVIELYDIGPRPKKIKGEKKK